MSSNPYRREDFEPPERRRKPLLIIFLVAASTLTHYAAFLGGAVLSDSRCRERVAAATATRPTCAALGPAAESRMQWKCTWTEHKNYHGACRDRLISEIRIPPKE